MHGSSTGKLECCSGAKVASKYTQDCLPVSPTSGYPSAERTMNQSADLLPGRIGSTNRAIRSSVSASHIPCSVTKSNISDPRSGFLTRPLSLGTAPTRLPAWSEVPHSALLIVNVSFHSGSALNGTSRPCCCGWMCSLVPPDDAWFDCAPGTECATKSL
eukprot:619887-Rhodomonas_salina.1